jgi:hypothetical protein
MALTLPDELWARVLAQLDYVEVAALSCCSRQLRRLGGAPSVWRALCEASGFGAPLPRTVTVTAAPKRHGHSAAVASWKERFRDRCVSCAPRRAERRSLTRVTHCIRDAARRTCGARARWRTSAP